MSEDSKVAPVPSLPSEPAPSWSDRVAENVPLETSGGMKLEGGDIRAIENPMMAWMRGGTLTTAYENQLAQQKDAAEKARKVEDARTKATEDQPDNARQHKMVVGGNKHHAGIVLLVKHPKDNTVLDYIECELTVDPSDGTSLILNVACFKCALRGVTDNFKFSQKHKRFELDTKRQGELWVNPKNPRHIVTLAGTIHLTEVVTCPNLGCGMRFVIDDSVIREK